MLPPQFAALPTAGKILAVLLLAIGLVFADAYLVIMLCLLLTLLSAVREAVRPGAIRRWWNNEQAGN